MRSKSERVSCIECNRPRDEVGRDRGDGVRILSWRGLCPDCSRKRMVAQHTAPTISDPAWLAKWREGSARAAGAIIPPKTPTGEKEK